MGQILDMMTMRDVAAIFAVRTSENGTYQVNINYISL